MTDFLKFALNHGEFIRERAPECRDYTIVLWCGDDDFKVSCKDCPNHVVRKSCNVFTKHELEYLEKHHPEILI